MKNFIQLLIFSFFLAQTAFSTSILSDWLPTVFDENVSLIEGTLFSVEHTNATRSFQVKYLLDDELLVDIRSAYSHGAAFDHSVNVMHRSEGNYLEELESFTVNGYDFILSTYINSEGEMEYYVSYTLAIKALDKMELFSGWSPDLVDSPNGVCYYELKFQERDHINYFMDCLIKKITDTVSLDQDESAFYCPKAYVKTYSFISGGMLFIMHNEKSEFIFELVTMDEESYEVKWTDAVVDEYEILIELDQSQHLKLSGLNPEEDDLFFINVQETVSNENDLHKASAVFSINPNPTHDFINISANSGRLLLINDKGQILLSTEIISQSRINLQQQIPGVYYVTFIEKGKRITKKIVKI